MYDRVGLESQGFESNKINVRKWHLKQTVELVDKEIDNHIAKQTIVGIKFSV